MARSRNLFEGLLNRLDEIPPFASERAYERSARSLSCLSLERLLSLVLVVGGNYPDPPEWALLECARLANEFETFADQDSNSPLRLIGHKPGDAELMARVGVNYAVMQREQGRSRPVSARAAIIAALDEDKESFETDLRRAHRHWAKCTTDRNGIPQNRWISMGHQILDSLAAMERLAKRDGTAEAPVTSPGKAPTVGR